MIAKGYRIVPIPSRIGNAQHFIYIKEHRDHDSKKSKSSKLFVGNLGFVSHDIANQSEYANEMEKIEAFLIKIFERFGKINNVYLSSNQSADMEQSINTQNELFRTIFAHVEFDKKSAVQLAIKSPDDAYIAAADEICKDLQKKTEKNNNLQKMCNTIKRKFTLTNEDPETLQLEVDSFMKIFEQDEELQKNEMEIKFNSVDDDGFKPAKNRNKRKRLHDRRGSGRASTMIQSSRNETPSNKKPKELKNFYRFQIREEKIEQLQILRKKFEEDKERVNRMKVARQFKPF